MTKYEELKAAHAQEAAALKERYDLISGIRLILAIGFAFSFYYFASTNDETMLIPTVLFVVGFLVAMKFHQRVGWKRQLEETLAEINESELTFLSGTEAPFSGGETFADTSHFYSYDLDVFGKNSLYQTLNRTATHAGGKKLADALLHVSSPQKIKQRQEAIKELSDNIEWRQQIFALGRLKQDSKESYEKLMNWMRGSDLKTPKALNIASYVLPSVTIICLILYFATPISTFGNIGLLLILVNLALLSTQVRNIMKESISSGEIDKILKQYSLIVQEIENSSFQSEELKSLQSQLQFSGQPASAKILELSKLFTRMDHIRNAYAGPVFNGLFLYHLHVLRSLYRWRSDCKEEVGNWLNVIGEFEAIGSFSSLLFNNPDYTFPSLNESRELEFKELGHPLLSSKNRITNDVSFNPQQFFILTGSNMSGKSTFLRTLGINMILANAGAPVCASHANVQPLPILVSMRLSDSLSESESYFFAEVKRLKEIMDALDEQECFVLLDEILRGTNSDDKRSGTIEVIRKMVSKNAIGAIATHDLEVCKTTDEFPEMLVNKRFEIEIVNDELSFDYKLRNGVCQNKSATFLMEKMGVI